MSPPRLLNVLSLDAVVVAVVWHRLLVGQTVLVQTSVRQTLVLAAIVWLVYTADRWMDGQSIDLSGSRMLRHDFARRYRGALLGCWIVVAVIAAAVAAGLPGGLLRAGAGLAGLVIAYAVITHQSNWNCWRAVKPYASGCLFALGVSLPMWSSADRLTLPMGLGVAVWSGLCVANCLIVSKVDRARLRGGPVDRRAIFGVMSLTILAWIALVRVAGLDRISYAAAGSIAALLIVRDLPHRPQNDEVVRDNPIRWHAVSFWADASLAVPAAAALLWS